MTTQEQQPHVRLEGQVALVTGAGSGIGRAMALALAQAGAGVAVCARSEGEVRGVAQEIADCQGRSLAVPCDVLHRHEVEDMVATVEATLGPIDLLVNNAGRFGPTGPLADADPDEWWTTVEVNLRGPLYGARAVLPGMLARGRGRIVNVSTSAALAAVPMLSAYVVSKAALYRLSESLAAETRGRGVTVFTLVPGLVRTAMTEAALSCGEPTIEHWFASAFADQEDVSPDRATRLLLSIASGAADALSGRYIFASDDLPRLVAQVDEIEQHDLYALRGRQLPTACAST